MNGSKLNPFRAPTQVEIVLGKISKLSSTSSMWAFQYLLVCRCQFGRSIRYFWRNS